MIKINLARKRRTSGDSSGAGLNLDLGSLFAGLSKGSADDGEKTPFLSSPLARLILAVGAFYAVDYVISNMKAEEIAKLDQQIQAIDTDKKSIAAKLQKLESYKPLQQQLENDEKVIRTKLEVVSRLLENRGEPARILHQIAKKIPGEVWLNSFKFDEKNALISGGAPTSNSISDFSNALSSIQSFSRIEIKDIRETMPSGKDVKYQQFELSAARKAGN